jgi:hypothetical protein
MVVTSGTRLATADPAVSYQSMMTIAKYLSFPGLLTGVSVLLILGGDVLGGAHRAGAAEFVEDLWPIFYVAAFVWGWGVFLASFTSLGATLLATVASIRWGNARNTPSAWPWVLGSWLCTGIAWLWLPRLL